MSADATKPKIFVFCNSCAPGWHSMVALAEDGVGLAGHLCSHHGFARGDMGFNTTNKHRHYNAHYPDGWELVWVENPQPGAHAGLDAAIALAMKSMKSPEVKP